jgi:hypothetical protein
MTTRHAGRRLLLARLLGPAEHEATCEECFTALDRYVDLQLAGADTESACPGLRPHLDGCQACREDYDSLRACVAALSPPP